MAQIKAEILSVCCTNGLFYPLYVPCDSEDKNHSYCDRKYGNTFECGIYCEHSAIKQRFIERQYKRFEASEHNTWDCFTGCYDLSTTNADHVCSYLEIDGRVYCDVRDDLNCYDPRTPEGGDSQ